ncbi:DEAD/DEAH box helicase [Bermanella sp. WJH001]|uniref:DEAD/DEAH box helicase n=1 Tax=Bermanella sp. WJH001 TaxID=3048005 RepID=UPI0024BF0D96|nr:DEAD/DEAH box helicase [Bermanella sp. WJH001]MDJ1537550.1 DEAD/DEAH box helicase [Bermanella sp. WJH001]
MPFGLIKKIFNKSEPAKQSVASKSAPKPATEKKQTKAPAKAKSKAAPKKKTVTPWDPSQFSVEPAEGKTRFHDLNLDERIMRGIYDLGFQYASPIQAASLPLTLAGHDIIGKAQTGTGKTAAFLITVLQKLLTTSPSERYASEPRALVIAPTRELAMQIAKDAQGLSKYTDINVVTVVGGVDYDKQKDELNSIVDIVVATPGRLLDFLQQKVVFLDQVELLVIDEADRMLDMGFIPDLKRIIRATPEKDIRQTQLFSATYPYDVVALSESWTYKPQQIEIEPESVATETVDQRFYSLQETEKDQVLVNLLNEATTGKAIIFANRRDTSRDLADRLNKMGVKAMLLSGEVAQQKRVKTLERFKNQDNTVLVATDVAGRGIHVDGITHVFNYNLPDDPEDYVHRIGRTGRAGASGMAITFIDEYEAYGMMDLEKYLGKKIVTEPVPKG